ncbi:Fic family protein [Lactobacillus helveticus]|uniref:Fic family protein n=1 Tax=Lactobacillus helveticus TaxID=1587 RepID=UPI000E58E109|nr:Fic family protein [Lactobacillus helveticus]RHX79839.1 Fic family protein [Lactobacillus helveticus]
MGTAGKFKQNENMILGANFQTSSVAETPIAVKQWAENTNYRLENSQTKDEFLQNLMAAHINFERIHPFEDGNGRTGRELINLELAKNEMPFLIIEKDMPNRNCH